MIAVTCRCGKQLFGSEAMAGASAGCNKCGRLLTFPAAPGSGPAAETPPGGVQALPNLTEEIPVPGERPAGQAPRAAAASGPGPRRGWDSLYWVLLLALLPLVGSLFKEEGDTLAK